jgi:hydrogenase maturation protease
VEPFFKILVYGYGNPGRQDDGLGIRLVEILEKWAKEQTLDHIDFDSNYQLNIEDAEIISHYDLVIFADASVEELSDGIALTHLTGENELAFTTHSASPGYIVHLCSKVFDHGPDSWLLHVRGYEWELKEGLSPKAEQNLEKAEKRMKKILLQPGLINDYL